MSTVDLSGVAWRKSSRSGNGGNGACVEVGFVNTWRKSSRSGQGDNGNCVEMGFAGDGVAVRDSKSPSAGAIVVPAAGWRGFLSRLR